MSCSQHYDDAIGDFDDAEQDLKISDSVGLGTHTSAALNELVIVKMNSRAIQLILQL